MNPRLIGRLGARLNPRRSEPGFRIGVRNAPGGGRSPPSIEDLAPAAARQAETCLGDGTDALQAHRATAGLASSVAALLDATKSVVDVRELAARKLGDRLRERLPIDPARGGIGAHRVGRAAVERLTPLQEQSPRLCIDPTHAGEFLFTWRAVAPGCRFSLVMTRK